jgi:hypothetical protein
MQHDAATLIRWGEPVPARMVEAFVDEEVARVTESEADLANDRYDEGYDEGYDAAIKDMEEKLCTLKL